MDGKRHIITIAAIGPDSGQTLTLGVYDALRQADALLLRTAQARRSGQAQTAKASHLRRWTRCMTARRISTSFASWPRARLSTGRDRRRRLSTPSANRRATRPSARWSRALPDDMAIRVLGGVTLTDAAACAAIPFGVNTENLRTVTALSTAEMRVQADCPQVVTEIDNRYLASDVKLWLGDLV